MSNQRKILHDDRNGLDYVLVGDYYLPVLSLPEETRPIGYWGMLRKEYMKNYKSGMYNSYITIIKEKRTALSRKRVPLNQNECTDDFRIGVPFEQNLQDSLKISR